MDRKKKMGAVIHLKTEQPTTPICAICGKPITANCTVDHVIPQAIYKWHESYLDKAEFSALRRRLTSARNTVRTHRRCNERKEESIVGIDGLHVSRRKRAKLRETYRAVEPYVQAFLEKKEQLAAQQQGRCFLCRAELRDGGVLRRIDDQLDRTWDNACLICHRCNARRVKSGDVKTYQAQRRAAAAKAAAKAAAAARPAAQTAEKSPAAGGPNPPSAVSRRRRPRHRRRNHTKNP